MHVKRHIGLRQRFVLLIIVLFVVLFGGIATILVKRTAGTEQSHLNEQSKSFATLATKPIGDAFLLYKDSGSVRIQQQVGKFIDLNPDIIGVSIVDTSGSVKFKTGSISKVTPMQAASFDPIYETKNNIIRTIVTPLIEDYGVHQYAVVYTVSDSRLTDNVQRTVISIALLSAAAFALTIIVTYQLLNIFFISPVRTISSKALKISNGSLEDQIELKRKDELGDLAVAVNTMANSLRADIAKLQEADKLKSEFIMISSHNLRTPLTAMKGNLEMLQDTGVSEEQRVMVDQLAASTARLDNFIEDLLAISTMESGKLDFAELKPQPIKALLQSIADDYVEFAKQKQLQFEVALDFSEDQQVVMSQHLLRLALVNLLENAFKFTKQGSVRLKAQIDAPRQQLVIILSDTGIGISEAEQVKLFTKFHRGTGVIQYDYEGSGIGLYLTKLILTDHHGTIEFLSQEGKGTTFTVRLPLASAPDLLQ